MHIWQLCSKPQTKPAPIVGLAFIKSLFIIHWSISLELGHNIFHGNIWRWREQKKRKTLSPREFYCMQRCCHSLKLFFAIFSITMIFRFCRHWLTALRREREWELFCFVFEWLAALLHRHSATTMNLRETWIGYVVFNVIGLLVFFLDEWK